MKKINKPLIRLKRQRVCVRARARGCFDSRKLTMCKRKQTKMELQSTRIELILLTYHTKNGLTVFKFTYLIILIQISLRKGGKQTLSFGMCHFGFVFFFIYIDCSDSFVDNLTLAVRDSIVWLSLSNGECRDSLHWQVGDTQTIENTCERAGLKLFCKHEDTFCFWFSIPPIVADFLTVDRLLSVCTKITLVCCVFL